ncbi:MAG: YncE family protein [Alphaproteobacteria bacterium]|nr:YncE family protein [Alphaproteobacteria bacterium]MDE2109675.1 YncE family protein [Alphaproteobacteria bacterium]
MSRSRPFLALAAAALVASVPASAAPAADAPTYHVTKTIRLGAPDRWDYVVFDPVTSRVYVAHGDRVTVVDGRSGAVIGNIVGMPGGTHGIGISHATGQGFTDDGRAGVVAAFDLKTLKVTKTIKAEEDADGISFDPVSGHMFVIDGDSAKLTVIDPKADDVVATVDAGGRLEFGVSGDNGKFYVDGAEKHEIVRVDTATNKADAHWPMPTCLHPHGLAIDRMHHRLFSSCGNKVMVVMNADDGTVLASLPIGEGTDAADFDPERGLAYSSNRDGTLSVVAEKSPDTFVALPAIPTEFGARTMALDPKTGRIYLVTADITENKSVPATDYRHRFSTKPGSVRLLFLDPVR